MNLFTLAYFLLVLTLHLAAVPLLLLLMFKAKYRRAIPARFFLWRNPPFSGGGIWFHACSVGETRALAPIVRQLDTHTLRISTVTQTGQAVAASYGCEHRFLPFETWMPLWVRPQRLLVVLEAEFWYLLFAVARARGARVVLLNARISERSFPKYRKMRWFYRRLFARVDRVFCQSEADKTRLEALGARRVEAIGNIKLAQRIEADTRYAKPPGLTVVAASTHAGEEALVLDAFAALQKHRPDARLLVVPRHPERFDAVWELLHSVDTNAKRWSDSADKNALLAEHGIVLVDAMGELNNLYAVSDVAVLGGAFNADVGGHNPLEPARFGCKTITGPHFFNQRELMRYVRNVAVVPSEALADTLQRADTLEPARIDGGIDLAPFLDYLKENT